MVTKEKFFEILDYIQENEKFENDLRDLLYNTEKDTDFLDGAMFTDCRMEDYILQLLENMFEDFNGWIGYWIYDLEFGAKWTPDSITDVNGKSIKLQTKEDLYNFLIHNQFEDFIGSTD